MKHLIKYFVKVTFRDFRVRLLFATMCYLLFNFVVDVQAFAGIQTALAIFRHLIYTNFDWAVTINEMTFCLSRML